MSGGSTLGCPRDAVLFDMDGVLVDSRSQIEQAWKRWSVERNLEWDAVVAIIHGRGAREIVLQLTAGLDIERELELLSGYEANDPTPLAAIPGAHDCVEVARRGSWAIVTSAARELARQRLNAIGVPLPEVLITANDVNRCKPDPEPYERASAALDVPADRCLVIEDSPAGIAAAKEAGMTVAAVLTTYEASALGQADFVLAGMPEVARFLEEREVGRTETDVPTGGRPL